MVPIVEMLQVTDPMLLRQVLKVVNQIVAEWNHDFQELFSMVGLIPGVIKFAGSEFARDLRVEAGTFISRLCNSGSSSLQMLIACGGLEAIVDLISYDYYPESGLGLERAGCSEYGQETKRAATAEISAGSLRSVAFVGTLSF